MLLRHVTFIYFQDSPMAYDHFFVYHGSQSNNMYAIKHAAIQLYLMSPLLIVRKILKNHKIDCYRELSGKPRDVPESSQ